MILVTGANGQLGTELRHLLDERNEEYVAVDVAEMDITVLLTQLLMLLKMKVKSLTMLST